jgi:hypothetical protein
MSCMTLTHHPVRLFRLSCGCLREYPMMPAGLIHEVLCVTCRMPSFTVTAYPEKACAVLGWAAASGSGYRMRVSCTRPPGCAGGMHRDDIAGGVLFTRYGTRLGHRAEGKTGRA